MQTRLGGGALWLIIGVWLIAACDKPPPAPSVEQSHASPQQKAKIALVMKTMTNPFFVVMEQGARQAEKDFDIDLLVKTAAQETSISQQIEIVDQLIRDQNVDAIIIAPGDSVQLIPILEQAQDAGIKIVNIDNRLDAAFSERHDLRDVPFISVDNEQGAYLSAHYIASAVTEPSHAVILEGIRSAANAQARLAGARRAFAENPNVQLVATETANWKIDEGYQVIQVLYQQYPQIRLIFCANDMMALGVIKYLQETQRHDVAVAAYDALSEAQDAIRQGWLAATVDQQAARQGYLGVEYAVRLLRGETLPAETFVDVKLVTAASLP